MTEIALAVVGVLLLAALVGAFLVYRQLVATRGVVAERERAIEGYLDTVEHEQRRAADLDKQLAVAKQAQSEFERREKDVERRYQEALKKADDASRETFKALAGDTLKSATDEFLKRAEQTFTGKQKDAAVELEQRKTAIENLLKPVNEKLLQATRVMGEIEKSRKQAYGGLREQLGTMIEDQRGLRAETANLVKALRRPEVRGQWGELQLRRVAELAGMANHCDFLEQPSGEIGSSAGGGAVRPDMLVQLPGGREIVVDAKTPITAFIDAAEATEDGDRDAALARHVRHIEDKVAELGSKRYQDHFNSADFVVLFIPGESFLYAAAQRKPGLIEAAMTRNVVIATPTTLISLLKVVALGWKEEQIADNAKKIQALGEELHKRVATLTQHLENLGKAVGKTVEHYNKFVGSFETQVVSQARKFKELGADSPKELPAEGEIAVVETVPREAKQVGTTDEPG